jgi:magnesium chelatase family protein
VLATSLTAALRGVDARLVRVEADTAPGFPRFTMLGLPDSCVRESEGRIRAALRNCGFEFKWDRRITVNLAPASLPKAGSAFDLATALGLLAADGAVPGRALSELLVVGELALDGALRPVSGVLSMMLMARRRGLAGAIVPPGNAREAALAKGLAVYPAGSLPEALAIAAAEVRPEPPALAPVPAQPVDGDDLADVRGQALARRALEIAAAGGHNLLFVGPPGAGKTMLARRLPGLLPPLSLEEALETTALHSAAGSRIEALMARRPFRAPHHSASDVALVGGGRVPGPGEVSLAHNGVLFLDELPEFRRNALNALRQPLEERSITLARASGRVRLPARFQLVAAMNPCPCGHAGDTQRSCRCTPHQVAAYTGRVSGPLLDRIDLHVGLGSLSWSELQGSSGEATAAVAARVAAARARQRERKSEAGAEANAELSGPALRRWASPDPAGRRLLERAMESLGLTARGHDRLLRVSRTIADLEAAPSLAAHHIAEALQFRP